MSKPTLTVVAKQGKGRKAAIEDGWKGLMNRNRENRPDGSLHNLLLILENDVALSGLFYLDESSNQVVLTREPPWNSGSVDEFTDTDACELAAWLQHPNHYGMPVSDKAVLSAVITVARRHRRHPIREYLQGLVWDGQPRVEAMLSTLFGVVDTPYARQAAICFAVGAVARVLWVDPRQPMVGAKVDFMLVVEGKQGKKKTTGLQTLFSPKWYVETLESPSGTDFYQILRGKWGVEIAEMDSFAKADITAVKAAITRLTDTYRAPYERVPRSYRRECVLVGTTNESEYLRDATGGRRFLPVRVDDGGDVNLRAILDSRDQLWAEAVHLFNEGVQWWVLPAGIEEEQEQRYQEDSWEGLIAMWLAMKVVGDGRYPPRLGGATVVVDWTTTSEVLQYAIGVDTARHDRQAQMRVAHAMKRLGWAHKRNFYDGRDKPQTRRWVRVSAAKGVVDDCPF